MGYQVVARFLHRASGRYVDPGQDCPLLPAEDAKRLVRARCLVEVPDAPPGSADAPPAARNGHRGRRESPPPPEEPGRATPG